MPSIDPRVNISGRELRLIRVDRWDSGMYICSTNASDRVMYNYTVHVETAPTVTAPRHGSKVKGEKLIAKQRVGHSAILRCKV